MSAARATLASSPVPTRDARARRNPEALEARRRAAVELLATGVPQAEVARRFDVSRAAVCLWSRAAQARGPDGLSATPRSGRPAIIPKDRSVEIADLVRRGPRAVGVDADHWSGARLRAFVEDRWGLRVSESTWRRWMRRHSIDRHVLPSAPAGSRPDPRCELSLSNERPSGRPPFVQFILPFGRLPVPGTAGPNA
jgi:transposase